MHIMFLGTAAAEGFPGIFCNCDNCNEARAAGGRSLRYRSVLLINRDLLIDFGPDLLAAAHRFRLNLSQVTTALITHAHPDHFHIENFHMRQSPFTGGQVIPTLCLFGPSDVTRALAQASPDLSQIHVETHTVHAFDTWKNNQYSFTAFRAYHAVGELECLFYSIEQGGHSILYATDTGSFPEETWQALEGKCYDVIILEETLGEGKYTQHMGFDTFLDHAERMCASGMLKPGGRFIAHHMSHSGNPTHEKLEAFFNPRGVQVAYDGLEIDLSDE